MTKHFGEHVTIDGYNGNIERLNSKEVVATALSDICSAIGMQPLAEPFVVSAPDNQIKDPGGWSGFLIIAESHISIHTFPRRRFFTADVYSCKNGIDVGKVVSFFKETFLLEDVEIHFIQRGLKYPEKNIA